ncbi:MAG: hypothetical protein EBU73_08010 [Chitinophagia bacterium]|nr:hypothetical protein [Chitinophagia bacterium]
MNLQGLQRKVTYVATYEAIALIFGTLGFFSFSDSSLERAGALAVFGSLFLLVVLRIEGRNLPMQCSLQLHH